MRQRREPIDELAKARGCLLSMVLGSLLWAGIIGGCVVVVYR